LMVMFDILNATNTNAVLQSVRTYGATVYTPNTIVQGRLFQLGAQFLLLVPRPASHEGSKHMVVPSCDADVRCDDGRGR